MLPRCKYETLFAQKNPYKLDPYNLALLPKFPKIVPGILQIVPGILQIVPAIWPIIANRKLKKLCRRQGDGTVLGDPKPQSGKPATEQVLAAMVRRGTRYRSLRLQKRDFRSQSCLWLTARIRRLLWTVYAESHTLRDMVSGQETDCEKTLVEQTIASR